MILFRYILANHAIPFIYSFFVVILVLVLQFLMRFAERLIGKGLDFIVIIQLIVYNLAWMVVLVVPMAALIATLMAFGNMAQHNEVAIMKASGMSLYKMMVAPMLGACAIAFLLVQFNNHVYPNANYRARILMQDISKKKPTLSLVPGVFSQEIPNYSILAREIDRDNNILEDLTIYDSSDPKTLNIVTAKKGKIYFSQDQSKLLMDLTNGEIHTSEIVDKGNYRKLVFERHKIAMPADKFTFKETAPGKPYKERELSAGDILLKIDTLVSRDSVYYGHFTNAVDRFFTSNEAFNEKKQSSRTILKHTYLRVENRLNSIKTNILSKAKRVGDLREVINSNWVEVHKKYSLPFACIVFVLIGAPLGTMTRKGGIGFAGGVSLLFFLVYWMFLMGGEKLADRNLLTPFVGAWIGNFCFLLLGIFLLIKSAKERVTLDFSFFNKLLPKQFRNRGND